MDGGRWLETTLRLDVEMRFDIEGGGQLALGPGAVQCRVAFLEVHPAPDEWDLIRSRLEIWDDRGHIFQTERLLGGDVFLEAIRIASPLAPTDGALELLLEGIHCRVDYRRHIPTVSLTTDGYRALAYWAKSLSVQLDLSRCVKGDRLAVRVRPCAGGLIGNHDAPEVNVVLTSGAGLILFPDLAEPWREKEGPATVFSHTGRSKGPQAHVTVHPPGAGFNSTRAVSGAGSPTRS